MTDTEHKCSQGVTMSTICNKIENIEKIITEMKEAQKEDMIEIRVSQKEFMLEMQSVRLNSAKYPDPDVVNEYIKKVDTHETRIGDTGKMIWIIIGGLVTTVIVVIREWITIPK